MTEIIFGNICSVCDFLFGQPGGSGLMTYTVANHQGVIIIYSHGLKCREGWGEGYIVLVTFPLNRTQLTFKSAVDF